MRGLSRRANSTANHSAKLPSFLLFTRLIARLYLTRQLEDSLVTVAFAAMIEREAHGGKLGRSPRFEGSWDYTERCEWDLFRKVR